MENTIKIYQEKISLLMESISKENEILKNENTQLKNKNIQLESKNTELKNVNIQLQKEKTERNNSTKNFNNAIPFNDKNLILGVNDINIKNNEAIHDAITFFRKKCPYCDSELFNTTNRKQYEIDHFFPVNRGGQDFPWNIFPVCQKCNRQKSDKLPDEFLSNDKFQICLNYLNTVKNNYFEQSIDYYSDKKRIIELIESETDFIMRNSNSKFIKSILYIVGKENQINKQIEIQNIDYYILGGLEFYNYIGEHISDWIGFNNAKSMEEIMQSIPQNYRTATNDKQKRMFTRVINILGYQINEKIMFVSGVSKRLKWLEKKI